MNNDPRLSQSSSNGRKNFYAFREVDNASPKEEVLSHFHEESECIYVLKGNLSFQINESKQVLREGDALLILPDTIHRDLIHEEGTQLIRIIVHPAMLTQEPGIHLHFIQPFLDSSKKGSFYMPSSHPLSKKIGHLLCETEKAEHSDDPYRSLKIAALLHMLLYEFCNAFPPEEEEDNFGSEADRMSQKQMVNYINENYGDKITLKDIAEAGKVSKSKCCSLFKTYMGISPIDYVNAYRLRVSRSLLEREDTPISDVAYTCGFSSQSYFTKLFNRTFHMTPRDYRFSTRQQKA